MAWSLRREHGNEAPDTVRANRNSVSTLPLRAAVAGVVPAKAKADSTTPTSDDGESSSSGDETEDEQSGQLFDDEQAATRQPSGAGAQSPSALSTQ